MNSDVPKVLHRVNGRPMIEYVLSAARQAGVRKNVVVVGYQAEMVREALSGRDDVEFALQQEQKGTGHAVMVCEPYLADYDGPVLVLAGDMPLVRGESLSRLFEEQRHNEAGCVIGTAKTEHNQGLGRIVRDDAGTFVRIVEEKDATPEERAIQEINTGCYVFDNRALFEALQQVRPDNQQAEYYLTDCPAILQDRGRRVLAAPVFDPIEAQGINTPDQLARVEDLLQQRGRPS